MGNSDATRWPDRHGRVTALSTGDFLRELEAAGRIQSADRILDDAAERGRNVDGQRRPVAEEVPRAVLRDQLMRSIDRDGD